MRKLISIALITLILFNVVGYYGLFVGLQYQNRQHLIQRFDSGNYDTQETVTIKVPLAVPYANDSREYERVDGEFKYNGEFFHMVKQRLYEDTLFIVCVRDHQSKRIDQALTDYVKTFSDKPSDTKSNTKILPTFIKEYLVSTFHVDHSSAGWAHDVRNEKQPVVFVDSFCSSIIHPPERA